MITAGSYDGWVGATLAVRSSGYTYGYLDGAWSLMESRQVRELVAR